MIVSASKTYYICDDDHSMCVTSLNSWYTALKSCAGPEEDTAATSSNTVANSEILNNGEDQISILHACLYIVICSA